MKREPALFVALLVAVINLGIHLLDMEALDSDVAEGIANAIVMVIGGLLIRRKVIPVATVNEAGLTSADVKFMAADPLHKPVKE